MLKEPNPLNVFEVRQVKSAPPHFEYVNLPMTYNLEDSLIKWIKHENKDSNLFKATCPLCRTSI